VLAHVGLAPRLDEVGIAPDNIHIRRWEDDTLLLDNPMGRRPVSAADSGPTTSTGPT
jgi:hypothetical protein